MEKENEFNNINNNEPDQNDPLVKLSNSIGDADSITLVLGISFIFLANLYFWGEIDLKSPYFVGLTVSGAIFAFVDFIVIDKVKNPSARFYTHFFLTLLAMLFIIVIPNIKYVINLGENTLSRWSNFATLVSMGFVILSIGMRNKSVMSESFDKHLYELNEEVLEKSKQLTDLTREFQMIKKEHDEIIDDYQRAKALLEQTQKEVSATKKSLAEAEKKFEKLSDEDKKQ